ncbi:MAG: hypothetical protein ACRECH_10185, partial [Nitrososphaerales archaeon]
CGATTCIGSVNAGDDFNLLSAGVTVSHSVSALETSLNQEFTYYTLHHSTNATLFDLGYYYQEMANGLSDMMHSVPSGIASTALATFGAGAVNPIGCGLAILAWVGGLVLVAATGGTAIVVIGGLLVAGVGVVASVYAC